MITGLDLMFVETDVAFVEGTIRLVVWLLALTTNVDITVILRL